MNDWQKYFREMQACSKASQTSFGASQQQRVNRVEKQSKESMSDISSVSEFESELGYASCENDDSPESGDPDGGKEKLRPTRKKVHRKHRLDQLRKFDIYSNDSDTTIEDTALNARRLKRNPPKREMVNAETKCGAIKPRDKSSNEFRRPRNGSKGSWTDSGVSMSKTDSQPSTLGERTKATRMRSQKLAGYNLSGEKHEEKAGDLIKEREESSPVQLLRGEISRRSRSASEWTKNGNSPRREKSGSITPISNLKDNETSFEDGEKSSQRTFDQYRSDRNEGMNGRQRCPEIIKLEDKEKSKKVVKVSRRRPTKDVHDEASSHFEREEVKIKANIEQDLAHLNEKETEIILQLLENAKAAESKRKTSVQSHWSQSTGDSNTDEKNDHVGPRRSKLQRLKDAFLSRVQRSRNAGRLDWSPLNKDLKKVAQCSPPIFDNYFSDEGSVYSRCLDHYCCCDFDEFDSKGTDQLSHLGRVVHSKKRKFFSRLFRSKAKSNENIANGIAMARTRSQIESGHAIGRKRSGSTRSLPESLKYLWLKALSKSVENMDNTKLPNLMQPADLNSLAGVYVKRSRSSASLYKGNFISHFPNDLSKSTEGISYCSQAIRSPPIAVRRSESLRSLNIGRNYDIATHVLQAKTRSNSVNGNNNLLYHPYFEGHTTRDDCNTDKRQDQDGSICTCCLNSPLASPCYKGYSSINPPNQSNLISSRRLSNEPNSAASPTKDSKHDAICCCHENYYFTGETCSNAMEPKLSPRKTDSAEKSQTIHGKFANDEVDLLIVAPLAVKITKERHADRVKLKTAKNFDSSVQRD